MSYDRETEGGRETDRERATRERERESYERATREMRELRERESYKRERESYERERESYERERERERERHLLESPPITFVFPTCCRLGFPPTLGDTCDGVAYM